MAGEFIPIVMFLCAAAVLIFRPLTTRVGKVIERSHAEKKAVPEPQVQRLMQLMERLVDRMDRLEDRVDFTERMLERQRTQAQLTDGPQPQSGRRYDESRSSHDDTF
jgi:isocitrate dehydrogenase kinase/phosphatase